MSLNQTNWKERERSNKPNRVKWDNVTEIQKREFSLFDVFLESRIHYPLPKTFRVKANFYTTNEKIEILI